MKILSSDPTSSVALYISSPEDAVGAFTDTEKNFLARINTMASSGLTVDCQVFQTLNEVAEYLEKTYPDGIDQLHFRGHGAPNECVLSSAPGGKIRSDLEEKDRQILEKICRCVRRYGILGTESCANGRGKDNLLKFLAMQVRSEVFVAGSRCSEFSIEFAHDLPKHIRYVSSNGDESRCYFKNSDGTVNNVALHEMDAIWNLLSSIRSLNRDDYDLFLIAIGLSKNHNELAAFKEKNHNFIDSLNRDIELIELNLRNIPLQKDDLPPIWQEILSELEMRHNSESVFTYHGPAVLSLPPRLNGLTTDERGAFHHLFVSRNPYVKAYLFLLGCAYIDKFKTLFMLLDNGKQITAFVDNPSIRMIYALSRLAVHSNVNETLTEMLLGRIHRQIKDSFQLAKERDCIGEWLEIIASTEDPCFNVCMEKISEFHLEELMDDINLGDRALKQIWNQRLLHHFTSNGTFAAAKPPTTVNAIRSWLNNPANAARIQEITELDLSDLDLGTLPFEIGLFRGLKCLDLSNNQLSYLPETIGDLTVLTELWLNNNQLSHLPETFGNLRALTKLGLSENQLAYLPETIGNFTALTEFGLNKNQLACLPKSFGNLSSLLVLGLNNNCLSKLPDSFGNLRALIRLGLHHNKLTCLPQTFGGLRALNELWLDYNQLTELPEAFGGLLALKVLGLDGNQLAELPETFCNLLRVTQLWVNNNKLAHLPEAFGNLAALTELGLDNNQLSCLPETFGKLAALTTLRLDKNQLSHLPKTFVKLVALKELWINHNKLLQLPNDFGNLAALQVLGLNNNLLSNLPDSFGNLSALMRLGLDDNQFSNLSEMFCNLGALTELGLSNNLLCELPKSFGNLRALTMLMLDGNQLRELPESFGGLSGLTLLWLDGNRLTNLPKTFGNLNSLNELFLYDNPLLFISDMALKNKPSFFEIINCRSKFFSICSDQTILPGLMRALALKEPAMVEVLFNSLPEEVKLRIENQVKLDHAEDQRIDSSSNSPYVDGSSSISEGEDNVGLFADLSKLAQVIYKDITDSFESLDDDHKNAVFSEIARREGRLGNLEWGRAHAVEQISAFYDAHYTIVYAQTLTLNKRQREDVKDVILPKRQKTQ